MQLNQAQKEAVMHRSGPLLVLAAPGSGKTKVICNRVQYLIEECGVLPERICALTFTKEAAKEMQQRINQNHSYPVCLGTVHSLCYQIVSQHSIFKSGKLITTAQRRELIGRILQEQHQKEPYYTVGREEVEIASNEITKEASVPGKEEDRGAVSLYALYQKRKRELSLIDYDDLLLLAMRILITEKQDRLKWQKRFEYYMVDEFQDLNEIQFRILDVLSAQQENIMAVGDDDQSIYGFRGSSPDIMEKFRERYPDCHQVCLNTNYRSVDSIIELSGKCIQNNHNRIVKQIRGTGQKTGRIECHGFSTKKEQAEYIIKTVKKFNKDLKNNTNEENNRNTAILFRTRRELEEFYDLVNKDAQDADKNYLQMQSSLLQDLKHYASLFQRPDNLQDILAIMNHPDRGLSRIFMPVEEFSLSVWEQFCKRSKAYDQAEKISLFRTQLENAFSFGPALGIRYLMDACGYRAYIIDKYNKNGTEKNELEITLKAILNDLNSLNWKEFEEKLNYKLINLNKEMQGDRETLYKQVPGGTCLLTMHAAKGLEFQNVVLPNLNEGMFPSAKSIRQGELEQERRLFYVAMTRARQNLLFTYLSEGEKKKKSRFLSELGF
ncbi:MAG: ATP-dependent helicase [Lachnospiraceae bacterium]